ncbi:MAG TPA: PIN domain-containing protein, partial [Thermoanaerobaculia bacterium]
YLDTHVVAWLYAGRTDLFPALARALIEGNDLLISPMTGLELQYLYEIRKTSASADTVIAALQTAIGLQLCDLPFTEVGRASWKEKWTRDPFDRMIVAQAKLRGAPLLTKDRTMRRRYKHALWDRPRA